MSTVITKINSRIFIVDLEKGLTEITYIPIQLYY